MTAERQELRSSPNLVVEGLLPPGSKESLWGVKPSEIARYLGDRLNQLANAGWDIRDIVALPDFHNFGSDGGIKDILLVGRHTGVVEKRWNTHIVVEDSQTMRGEATNLISQRLQYSIQELESAGFQPRHIVAITDHSIMAMVQGFGGFDGLKNFVICYQTPE